jgi:hypothetical protein
LTLPMSPGSVYAREFPLARVAHGPPLSRWQRQLLRWAVVLRPVAATEKGVQVNAILEELAADARHTAGKGDAEGFGRAYADLTGLHASLLAACLDKTDTGEPGSWAMLKDSGRVFGVPLHQGWYGVYRGIFQSAVTCMALDTTPLRLLCSLSRCLDGDALQASPVEMREELLQLPSALMYQLGLWWAARAEEQGFVDHGHHLGVKLRPPLGGVYEAALSEFVAGWENSRPEGLGRHRQQVPADWGDLRTRARLSAKHIEASARMLLSAVMRGDQAAAEWLADMLSTWWGSHDFHIQPFQLHDTSAFITVEDLLCDWPKLREQLGLDTDGDEDDQRSRPVLQQGVFRAALCNYWTDIRLLCIELMLAWVRAVPVEQAGTSLALDVVCGLLTGKRWRAGGHSFGSFEALSSADYLTAKVRQFAASGEWRGGYLGRLDAFVERAKGLDRPGMISSRIYTFDGADDVESLQESQLELLAVLAEGAWAVPRPVQQQLDRWLDPQVGPYRAVDLMRDRLRSWLERLDQQPGLSGEHIGLLKEKVRPGVTAVDAIGHVKTSLQQMRDAIEGQRAEVLVRQPIDAQRLKQIASFASSTAFNGKEGHFPIHLFAIGHQSEALEEGSLTFTRIRRGELTPLQMEHPASGEDEYFADVMAQHVAMTVLHDVIRQSEVTELEVPDAESYWKVLKAASRDIESPMLLLDNETLPDWVWDWQHPDERSRFKRPDELRVQRREGRGAGYVCDFNDIEVYVAPLPAGQSLLMSKAAFRQLTFTDFGEGRFVKVDVVEPTADKPLVDLRLTYSRKVETVPSRALRLVYAQRR